MARFNVNPRSFIVLSVFLFIGLMLGGLVNEQLGLTSMQGAIGGTVVFLVPAFVFYYLYGRFGDDVEDAIS